MDGILLDFPVREICFNLPEWILSLDGEHWLRRDMLSAIKDSFIDRPTLQLTYEAADKLNTYEFLECAKLSNIRMGSGQLNIDIKPADNLFYRIVKETGLEIDGEKRLFSVLKIILHQEYLKVEEALEEVKAKAMGCAKA